MQMKDKGYETLNPEIYPYMKRYISFARKATMYQLKYGMKSDCSITRKENSPVLHTAATVLFSLRRIFAAV